MKLAARFEKPTFREALIGAGKVLVTVTPAAPGSEGQLNVCTVFANVVTMLSSYRPCSSMKGRRCQNKGPIGAFGFIPVGSAGHVPKIGARDRFWSALFMAAMAIWRMLFVHLV